MIEIGKRIWFSAMIFCACVAALQGDAFPCPSGPEGIDWQLVEVAGAPVSLLASEKQPYIKLDPEQKRAAGFSGCNNFFSGYEINGSSLKFGLIGATRMACPDQETRVETEFFKALEKTGGWKIDNGVLLLVDDGDILARFKVKRVGPAPDLGSMTFLSTWFSSGKVTLSHGEYREPTAPDSASETVVKPTDKRVFGFIEGLQTGAVVLVTDTAGSGTFYDLALIVKEAKGWVNTDAVFLGDRVKVHSVAIENDHIIIAMTTHGPNDPMCCPTQEVKRSFSVQGGRLIPAAEEKTGGERQITGTVWRWEQTLYNDDSKNVPKEPNNYTVEFLEDGRISVKADCNLKGGVYSADGMKISIEITHSTMAACGEGSLEKQFVRDLTAAAIFFLKDRDLYLDLKYDAGTMKFSKRTEE